MKEPPEAVNMSLGLSMTKDPQTSKIMVCGPTIPKACVSTTTYNGMCFTIDGTNVDTPIPNKLRDCPAPAQTDIAFLLDGSGSVSDDDFVKMKEFVITLIQGLSNRDIRFAVAQYSDDCTIHVRFTSTLNAYEIRSIWQKNRGTNTAGGINKLVNELFAREARPGANRVLIVITDGVSTTYGLPEAAENARRNKIIRYAIGVGWAFNNPSAENELNIIASDPDSDYKFKVGSFDVLDKIRKTLETNIIAIEGTQTSGDSTRMEFAQDGFSAAFVPNRNVVLSAVGAFQWKGGFQEYSAGRAYEFQQGSEHDSYLGYSMTVAKRGHMYVVLGAPRHEHKGVVVLSSLQTKASFQLIPPEPQIGAYFGAEVCAVDLNSDSYTDLLLVSAPLHTQDGREGKVFVFSMSYRLELKMTLNGMAGQKGRFGSSVASPADLNGDKIPDVVVGAPLEDNGQGSIYIFNGRTEDITPTYSQRISGSSVQTGLRFFGLSLSESALDHSGDRLTDIAVGSKGRVILLRSRPIVSLVTKVTYSPSKIPTKSTDCANPLENTLRLCFTMSGVNTQIRDLAANINYTLKLDAKRQNSRAYFSPKNRLLTDKMTVQLQEVCREHKFYIETCTENALNPLSNELTFAFEGLPLSRLDNLKPVLHPDIRNTSNHNVRAESLQ
ncbi:integrin alpha-X-like [Colossoma macropomum]|uniref:integrin alpha-X-like n=1 Tax=Colossoma macropomum TaxID=42526 RepID=UPI001863DA5C|nr:integrin alpha-X-like [Colossoma macropomum]